MNETMRTDAPAADIDGEDLIDTELDTDGDGLPDRDYDDPDTIDQPSDEQIAADLETIGGE